MNSPSNSSSSLECKIVSLNSIIKVCEVCGLQSHGTHYGAISCRACAAFFRRYGVDGVVKPCKKNNKCVFLKKGWFNCKQCRLQKCWNVGMKIDGFQFDRDPERVHRVIRHLESQIPPTMDTFLGKPNFIIYCAPAEYTPKVIIDVQFLVDKAEEVLIKGSATPIYIAHPLEKLALGLQQMRNQVKKGPTKIIRRIGKEEAFELFEDEMLKAAKFLTYFDEFQQLPQQLRFDMLRGIWRVWTRLDKLAITAAGRRQMDCKKTEIMAHLNKDLVLCDMAKVEIDLSWCTHYTLQQLSFFSDRNESFRTNEAVLMMMDLNPTDVELVFMMCQLSFHYVGKRYQGIILEIADRLQEILSNNLHDYYVNRMNMPQYSKRVAQMMKINNHIQTDIFLERSKQELLKVFDIYYADYSRPDVFREI